MNKLLFLTVLSLMVFALVIGCGQKADEATDKVPVETKKAEMMESTRMDSMIESAEEVVEEVVDSVKTKIDGL